MGRSSGLGGIIEGVTGKGGTLTGRGSGIPMPMFPTESVGIMSGSMRNKTQGRRRDERKITAGSSPNERKIIATSPEGSVIQSTPKPQTGSIDRSYEAVKRRLQSKRRPMDIRRAGKPKFDPSKPSAVMETERVNVQDPTLGGPPEREVPMPKERDTSPRGPAPFSPDERAMARDAFFEKMFSRADERKQSRAMDQEERRNVMDARRDEAAMRDSERGMRNEGGGRRRMRRRDFTRRRSQMEGKRSREERAAFRDRYVSTVGNNFFS